MCASFKCGCLGLLFVATRDRVPIYVLFALEDRSENTFTLNITVMSITTGRYVYYCQSRC